MKWCAIGVVVMAVIVIAFSLSQPQHGENASLSEKATPASSRSSLVEPKTSSKRRVTEQKKHSQEDLAKQFIIEAENAIDEKSITFGVMVMYLVPDQLANLAGQMDRQTVLQLLDHYPHWDQDVYVCGVCCHLLKRLAQLAPEEAVALYEKTIGLSKVTAMLKLSDGEDEEDLEKNPKAIPTLSLMAMASGYEAGKPGSRTLLQAFRKTIPWPEIARYMVEEDEKLVGENAMLCLMLFFAMLTEECKVQPDFALAELRALPVNDAMKMGFLSNLVDDEEIAFRHLQQDVESHVNSIGTANDEKQLLALNFAKRIFAESPDDAAQWLAQHKLPLEDRSASELDSFLDAWTADNHATCLAWANQLDHGLRSRIAAQKMEQLCVSLANAHLPMHELPREYEMLDSLLPHVSSSERLLLIKNIAKRNVADDKRFLELLHHLKYSETEIQSFLEEKNRSE